MLLITAGCVATPSPRVQLVPEPPPLPEALSLPEIDVAALLLRLEDTRDFDTLLIDAGARASEPSIRARAALAAGRIERARGRTVVRELLTDSDSTVLAAASFMAGQLRDTAAVGALIQYVDTAFAYGAPTVAVEAAGALGKIGTGEARTALANFLAVAEPFDLRLGPVIQEAIIASWRAGETAVAPFARWVDHADPRIRWRVAYALTRRPRAEAVPLVLPLLADADPLTRSVAIRGVHAPLVAGSSVAVPEVLRILIELAADSDLGVRVEALRALGTYEGSASRTALESYLGEAHEHVVIAALESLGRLGPSAGASAAEIQRLLAGGGWSDHTRGVAIETLAAIDPAGAEQVLNRNLAVESWRIRAAITRALARRPVENIEPLMRLARDVDARVATAALDGLVTGLGAAGMGEIRSLLFEQLHNADTQVRAAALRGFVMLRDPASYPQILDAYDRSQFDQENEAALASLDALAVLAADGSVIPERAFFTRFRRPEDHHIRAKAVEVFGAAAGNAWGDVLPLESHTLETQYRGYIAEWVAPSPPQRNLPRVRIITTKGTIDAILFADDAPLTAANFLRLAEAGFFDGQEWPRVVPNFVVQGGDPRGDTSGGPGYTIRDELNRSRFETGTLGMALAGPDTGGSQFFVTLSPQPHLDGIYTVFGRVLDGLDILERIVPGDRIVSVRQLRDDV